MADEAAVIWASCFAFLGFMIGGAIVVLRRAMKKMDAEQAAYEAETRAYLDKLDRENEAWLKKLRS